MAQKMTLTAYLAQRGKKAKALTKGEADLLGISFPLQSGWPRKYGAIEIDEPTRQQLVLFAEAAHRAAADKASQKPPQIGAAAAAGLVSQVRSPVPGFVLRQARRYRKLERAH